MIRRILTEMYSCVCDICGHVWASVDVPKRCAKCKRRSWNQPDKRFKVPKL